jgi:hypothetical protein
MKVASSFITKYQAGFMKDRFIGDHDYAFKLILQDAGNNNNNVCVSGSSDDVPSGND